MGRYYSGDINGKFWFGCQNSLDAETFGVPVIEVIYFEECGCKVVNFEDKFCTKCYESQEKHYEAYYGDEFEVETDLQRVEYEFEFSEDDRENIENVLKEIQFKMKDNNVDGILKEFLSWDYDGQLHYNNDLVKTVPKEFHELFARYSLGLHIIWGLDTNDGECSFKVEI